MTITFLFLAYFQFFGRLFMVRNSVCVRITLFSKTGSTKGAMSFSFPHRADPYSSPCRYFFAFFLRYQTTALKAAAPMSPTIRSHQWKLGTRVLNARPKYRNMFISFFTMEPPVQCRYSQASFSTR